MPTFLHHPPSHVHWSQGYGLTETSPVISVGSHQWTTRRLGCVGTPLHNVTVQILDPETKEERPVDTDGEICVAGPSVMTGYRNNPQVYHNQFAICSYPFPVPHTHV